MEHWTCMVCENIKFTLIFIHIDHSEISTICYADIEEKALLEDKHLPVGWVGVEHKEEGPHLFHCFPHLLSTGPMLTLLHQPLYI
jgi:hypothetical protein